MQYALLIYSTEESTPEERQVVEAGVDISSRTLITDLNTDWKFKPDFVTRAMNDFRFICVTALSFHIISPSIISPRSVRYQRAWNRPRY